VIRAFTRLQVSAVSAHFADGMSLVAFPLIAASFTSSPLVIGAISAAGTLPWLLTSIHIGALIDRKGAGRLLVNSHAGRAVVFLVLLVLVLAPSSFFLLCLGIVAFLVGVLEVVADNATQTLIPSVVPPAELPKANARMQLIQNTGLNLVGAPVASALLSVHLAAPLAVITVGYSVATASLRKLANRAGEQVSDGLAVLAGWTHIRQSRALFTLAATTSLLNLALGAVPAILVLYVEHQLHAPTWTYGLLLTSLAMGTLAGAVVVPLALARTSETFVLRFVLITLPVPMFAIAVTTSFWIAAGAQLFIGALEIAWGIVAVSYRQEVVPYELLGRVNAIYRMMAWGSIPVGALLAGALAELTNVSGAYLCVTAILCAGWIVSTKIRPEVLDADRRLVSARRQGES
jgi:MFS family permease